MKILSLLEQGSEDKLSGQENILPIFAGVFFALYDWNKGPVYRNEITWSVLAIGRELPLLIGLPAAR